MKKRKPYIRPGWTMLFGLIEARNYPRKEARDWAVYQRWCGAGTKSPQYGTSAREEIAAKRRLAGHGRPGWRRIHILNNPNILEIK